MDTFWKWFREQQGRDRDLQPSRRQRRQHLERLRIRARRRLPHGRDRGLQRRQVEGLLRRAASRPRARQGLARRPRRRAGHAHRRLGRPDTVRANRVPASGAERGCGRATRCSRGGSTRRPTPTWSSTFTAGRRADGRRASTVRPGDPGHADGRTRTTPAASRSRRSSFSATAGALAANRRAASQRRSRVTSGWGEAWYLVRVTQADGEKAYSSPIWIGANSARRRRMARRRSPRPHAERSRHLRHPDSPRSAARAATSRGRGASRPASGSRSRRSADSTTSRSPTTTTS